MSTNENREAVRTALEAVAEGRHEPFFALVSDDVVWTVTGTTAISGTFRGKADFAQHAGQPLQKRFAEPIKAEVRHVLADGDRVVALWDGTTTLVSGEPYHQRYCWVLRFEHGLVVEATTYWDTELITHVLGQPAGRTWP